MSPIWIFAGFLSHIKLIIFGFFTTSWHCVGKYIQQVQQQSPACKTINIALSNSTAFILYTVA